MSSPAIDSRPSWLFRVIPALDTLRHYGREDARGDLIAGVTVATVAGMTRNSQLGRESMAGLLT